MAEDCDHNYKFVILGDAAVGKSSLLLQFTESRHQVSYVSTIGTDFKIKVVNINGQRYKLHLWDTAGQERFRTIVTTYYRGAQAALIVYDITNANSFLNLGSWLHELHQNCQGVSISIVGNKCDKKDDRVVQKQSGEEFAREHGLTFYESSAKENININEVFEDLVLRVRKSEVDAKSMDISDFSNFAPPSQSPTQSNDNKNSTSCC